MIPRHLRNLWLFFGRNSLTSASNELWRLWLTSLLMDGLSKPASRVTAPLFNSYSKPTKTKCSPSLSILRGDRSVAEDVTQQIFLKLFTAIRQFRGDSEFTTWLYRLVVNACLDESRRRRRLLPWGETVAMRNPSDKKPQEKQYARLEVAEAVRAAIGELKPKFRLPILLKYIEGLSYEEIASVMGCSKGTVASRLNRGHSQLAKRLSHLNNPAVWSE